MNMKKLWWWQADDDFMTPIARVLEMRNHPRLEEFGNNMEIVAVMVANRVESTVPDQFDNSETHLMLQSIQDGSYSPPNNIRWPSEGSHIRSEVQKQLAQHAFALRFVIQTAFSDPAAPLMTSEFIRRVHAILMKDSTDVQPGAYRTVSAHNGAGFQYDSPQYIESYVDEMCDKFVELFVNTSTIEQQCSTCAWLMYRFLVIHPFENGNGRVARLLVTYAFLCMGSPFIIPLSDGTLDARKHYLYCVNREHKTQGYLSSHLLECYAAVCSNFLALVGTAGPGTTTRPRSGGGAA